MRTIAKSNVSGRVIRSDKARVVIKGAVSTKIIGISKTTKVSNAKIGSNMDYSRFRYHKTPTPATNGAQLVFTIPNSEEYLSGLLEIFLDGLIQIKDTDYSETSSTTFTMTAAPDADEVLRINYIRT